MSGPIVRTGTTPKFWQNWDQVFGGKKKRSGATATKETPASGKKATVKAAAKPTAKPAKAALKTTASKKAKKAGGKKK